MVSARYYRGCILPETSRNGLFTAYVQFNSREGKFVRADTLGGLKQIITHTLEAHGMRSSHRN